MSRGMSAGALLEVGLAGLEAPGPVFGLGRSLTVGEEAGQVQDSPSQHVSADGWR